MASGISGSSLSPAAAQMTQYSASVGAQQAPKRREDAAAVAPLRSAPAGAGVPERAQLRPRTGLPPLGHGTATPMSASLEPMMNYGRPPGTHPPPQEHTPLPLPGEGPSPPTSRATPPRLRWPNGHHSAGTVRYRPEGPVFEVASLQHDAVLAQRGRDKPVRPGHVKPAPLPVMATPGDPGGRHFIPRLPDVLTDGDFDAEGGFRVGETSVTEFLAQNDHVATSCSRQVVTYPELAHLVMLAGGRAFGTDNWQEVALKRLFGRSLEAVAGQCQDPQAARNVAQALRGDDRTLFLKPESPSLPADSWGMARADFDIDTFRSGLTGMGPGQHKFIRVTQRGELGGHAMGIGIQKQPDGRLRISVINSNGWVASPLHPDTVVPAAAKTVSMDEAVAAMETLLSGPLPQPKLGNDEQWTALDRGRPLWEWLNNNGTPGIQFAADFHEPGRTVSTTRQKQNDCGMECLFAFMASALKPADYKLAKAACLNTLVQIGNRLESPESAPAFSELQLARLRLQERITTSLSGHMVAPQAGPAEASQANAAQRTG